MSAYYTHKNLELIPDVIRYLRDDNGKYEFEFILMLSLESDGYNNIMRRAILLGVEGDIHNIGPGRVSDGPSAYEKCHLLSMPEQRYGQHIKVIDTQCGS